MEKNCGACGSTRFRLSRFRLSDFPKLLAFHYPVRCVACQERSFASLSWVMEYRRRRARRT
jgi:hypothetical protein